MSQDLSRLQKSDLSSYQIFVIITNKDKDKDKNENQYENGDLEKKT